MKLRMKPAAGLRLMALGQGASLVGLGAWPIVSMRTFERVTGPKRDDWLVRTVGGLCVAIGIGLMAGGREPRSVRPLGLATAATFAAVDLIGYRTGRLSSVYLLDAVAESAIIAGWSAASWPGAARPTRRLARRLLAGRGRSAPRTPTALRHPAEPRAMHTHAMALLDEARHVATQAWPASSPPRAIRASMLSLERAVARLEAAAREEPRATDPAAQRHLARVIAGAEADAAIVQDAARLVSS
jgi:hypothetical protein